MFYTCVQKFDVICEKFLDGELNKVFMWRIKQT